jgi:hypothetical protein
MKTLVVAVACLVALVPPATAAAKEIKAAALAD